MTDQLAATDNAWTDALRSALLFVPTLLLFLAILLVGWLVAWLLAKAVTKVLGRIGFDRWVERGGIKTALARSKYDATGIVAKLVYYAVLLFALQLAFGIWGPNPVSALIGGIVAWLPRAFIAIVIVVVAAAIASGVRDVVSGALGGLAYGRLLGAVAYWFIIGLGVIAALNQIGVATTVTLPVLIAVLAAVAGILIVGVGGGLVRPMQQRWEGWLNRAGEESAVIAEKARAYSADQAANREAAARREAEAAERRATEEREAAAQRDAAEAERRAAAEAKREAAERAAAEKKAAAELAAAERAEQKAIEARAAAERQAAAERAAATERQKPPPTFAPGRASGAPVQRPGFIPPTTGQRPPSADSTLIMPPAKDPE
jgi:hypothetical protein